jgi:hypothetical protein
MVFGILSSIQHHIHPFTNNSTYPNDFPNTGSLTHWNTSIFYGSSTTPATVDMSMGNPVPSIYLNSWNFATYYVPNYISTFTTFNNRTIQLDMMAKGFLINLFFACSSDGYGQMFRLDCRPQNYSGFAVTRAAIDTDIPTSGPTFSPNVWYTIIIRISDSGVASYSYYKSSLGPSAITNDPSTFTITNGGLYIGLHGDQLSGGWFDNIFIT